MTSCRIPTAIDVIALTLAVLSAFGCKAFDESLLGDGGATECVPTKPPARGAAMGGDGPERVYGLRDVFLEQGGDWRTTGWDRDDICTGPPDFEAECRPPLDEDGIEQDGMNGIDNAFGHELVPFAIVLGSELQAPFRAAQARGPGVILVRVRGWDGQPDDGQVEVTLAPAAFGTPPDGSGGVPMLPGDGSLPPTPEWDGMDFFWADEAAFVAGDDEAPLIRDDNAHVSGGLLVARPPDRSSFFLVAADRSVEIILSDAVLTARISDEGLQNVILAGRWANSDLLTGLKTLGFCEATDGFDRMQRLLEIQADVRAVAGSGGPGTTCDALSTGIGFTGVPVQWAGLATPPLRADGCE